MNIPDHIIVKESTRARRIALRLDTKARAFNLVVPKGMSKRRAMAFAEQHEDWMQERLKDLPEIVGFEDGSEVPLFGKARIIDIYFDRALKSTKIKLTSTHLEVRTNKEDANGRIVRFLKAEVKKELERLSYLKAAKIDQHVKSVSVRDTKSRWGSCSHGGALSYSWRLIFAPYEALDYVVAHEVAHLKHLDHSKDFWRVCESLSEDYKGGYGWMKKNGQELMKYG